MRHFVRSRTMLGVATLSVAALALAGCAAADDAGDTAADVVADTDTAMAAGCEAFADYMGNEGETVEIYTTIIEP